MDSKVFYLYYIHLNTQKKVFCACMSKAMFVSSSMHTVLIDTLFKIFLVILELLLLVYSTQWCLVDKSVTCSYFFVC
jgi:hypothetical protein